MLPSAGHVPRAAQAAKPLAKGSDLDELLAQDRFLVVRWFSGTPAEDDDEHGLYQDLAAALRKQYTMYFTTSPLGLTAFGAPADAKPGAITTFLPRFYVTPHDTPTSTWQAPAGWESAPASAWQEAAAAFINHTTYPLVGKFSLQAALAAGTGSTPTPYTYDVAPMVAVFADLASDETFRADSRRQLARIAAVAAQYAHRAAHAAEGAEGVAARAVTFAHMASADPQTKDLERGLGLAELDADFKAVYFANQNRRQGVKYVMGEDTTLAEFVAAAVAGQLEPHVRSARAPKQSAKAAVTVVVGSTLQRIVHDAGTDCLLLLCSKWSPDCEAFQPKYAKLGKKVKAVVGLVVATIDVGVNDVPAAYDITALPALYLAPRAGPRTAGDVDSAPGSRDDQPPPPVRYQGALEQKALLQFLRDSTALVIPKAKGKKSKKGKTPDGGQLAPTPAPAPAPDLAGAHAGSTKAGKDEL